MFSLYLEQFSFKFLICFNQFLLRDLTIRRYILWTPLCFHRRPSCHAANEKKGDAVSCSSSTQRGRRYTSIHVRRVVPNVIQEYTLWQDKTERLRYDSPHAIRMVLNLRPLELGPWAALICPHALSLLPLHRVVIQWKLRKHKQWLTTWEYYHKISFQFYVP